VTDAQRRELGRALAAIHRADIPPAERGDAAAETYGPASRNAARELLALAERRGPFQDEVAADMAAFMRRRASTIRKLIDRATALAETLLRRQRAFVLCHGDLHAGNLHVADDGRVYIVDWDTLIFAPPERDLIFVGAGIDRVWRGAAARRAFYAGYGPAGPDPDATAYYRCERAVEDIAAFGEALLLSGEGGADRAQSLRYFRSAFGRGDAIPTALKIPA
jgi:spectinomycin phosphotransferase